MALDDRGYNANFRKIGCKYPICARLIKFLRNSKQSQTTYVGDRPIGRGAAARSCCPFLKSFGAPHCPLAPTTRISVIERRLFKPILSLRRPRCFRWSAVPFRGANSVTVIGFSGAVLHIRVGIFRYRTVSAHCHLKIRFRAVSVVRVLRAGGNPRVGAFPGPSVANRRRIAAGAQRAPRLSVLREPRRAAGGAGRRVGYAVYMSLCERRSRPPLPYGRGLG